MEKQKRKTMFIITYFGEFNLQMQPEFLLVNNKLNFLFGVR